MKSFAILIFVLFCVCFAIGQRPNITNWGQVKTIGTFTVDYEIMNIRMRDSRDPQEEIFTYPDPNMETRRTITIDGISLWDYRLDSPSEATILDGGIGASFVKIRVVVAPGGHGSYLQFQFFFSDRTIDDEPKHIKDFIETNFEGLE